MRLPRRSIFSEEKQRVEQTLTFIANIFRGLQNFRLQKLVLQIEGRGNSLVVQRLGLCAVTFGAQVQILVGELRSCKPCSIAKKKKLKGEEWLTWQSRKSLRSPPSMDTPKQLFTKKLLMGKATRQAEKRPAAKDIQKEPHQYRQEGRSSDTTQSRTVPLGG